MSAQYKQLLKLIEKWPLDKSKAGRDLGERIRAHLPTLHNPTITATAEEIEDFSKQIDSLKRLSNNVYYNNYKRTHSSTATGLTADQCSQVLSSEFLQYLNDTDKKD